MDTFNFRYGKQDYSVLHGHSKVEDSLTEYDYFTVRKQPSREVVATVTMEQQTFTTSSLYLWIQKRIMEGFLGLPPQEYVGGDNNVKQ